jgi:MT0933-like antitoxin protein
MPDFKELLNKARGLAGKHQDQVHQGVEKAEDVAKDKLGHGHDSQVEKGGDMVEGALGVNDPERGSQQ